MLDISQELLPLIQTLMPGFLMTMAFYWFAELPKPTQSERILQALIGTSVIQACMLGIEHVAYRLGSYFSFGAWSADAANLIAIVTGGGLGLALAYFCNNDVIYSMARRLKLTTKASLEDSIHVYQTLGGSPLVLHLKDERRLMGYMQAFPNNKETGFYLIDEPHWVHEGVLACEGTRAILISSSDVQWVEFLKPE